MNKVYDLRLTEAQLAVIYDLLQAELKVDGLPETMCVRVDDRTAIKQELVENIAVQVTWGDVSDYFEEEDVPLMIDISE